MSDPELVLRVQAFVDGELRESEQADIAALIARDADVSALAKELKQTRQALAGFDAERPLPESREFYWSKIQRAIEQLPVETPPAREPSLVSTLLRWILPATCAAGLLVLGVWMIGGPRGTADVVVWQAANDEVNALTYRDYEAGMTVMWLSYPTDNAVADPGKAAIMP